MTGEIVVKIPKGTAPETFYTWPLKGAVSISTPYKGAVSVVYA